MILDEILSDPVLRQAYDHFGHSAVAIVRHDRYDPLSMYMKLSNLHQQGKTAEAKELLTSVLENAVRERRRKDWKFDAYVDVSLTVNPVGSDEYFDVSGTDVSFTSSIPILEAVSSEQGSNEAEGSTQQMQLAIGSRASLEKGLGSTRGSLTALYKPSKHTHLSSSLIVGYKHFVTSLSSVQHMASGTVMSAQISRKQKLNSKDNLAFVFSSNRTMSLMNGRMAHAAFALNLGFSQSRLQIEHGNIVLSTSGLWSEDGGTGEDHHRNDDEQSDAKSHSSANADYYYPPKSYSRLTAKLAISQFPLEMAMERFNLFNTPDRSIEASVSYNPFEGIFSIKTMLCRELSETTFFSVGLTHVGMNGLTWMLRYQREELTLCIPIFVATFLSPMYWNTMLMISSLSYLVDAVVGEVVESHGIETPGSLDVHARITAKETCLLGEQYWMDSSSAKLNSSQQLLMMETIAKVKREYENATNGLVVISAKYTWVKLADHPSMDVTFALQFWVQDSSLVLPPQTKRILLGFYDISHHHRNCKEPYSNVFHRFVDFMNTSLAYLGFGQTMNDANESKEEEHINDHRSDVLKIRYKYKGIAYEIEIDDEQAESLPSPNALALGSGTYLY